MSAKLCVQDIDIDRRGFGYFSVSKEKDVENHHDIVDDGYNIGRNELAASAIGTTSFGGVTYSTTARNVTGLMAAGSQGVNHGTSALRFCPRYHSA